MPRDKDNLYWNKKDGERILIKDMSDDYLLQTIKNLENQARNKNGEIDETKLHKKFYVLKTHALHRNLIK